MFYKSVLLLDQDQSDEAEQLLKQTISEAENEQDEVTLGEALCCLGHFLYTQSRDAEALPYLERVASIERDDDLIDTEIKRAREIVSAIKGQ